MGRQPTRAKAIDRCWDMTQHIHCSGSQLFQSELQAEFAKHLSKFFSTDRERLALRAIDELTELFNEAYEIGRQSCRTPTQPNG